MRSTKVLYPRLQEIIPFYLYLNYKKKRYIKITECYRTLDEQNALYAQGRTTPGSIVTNCKGTDYSSPHQWWIAFDICSLGSNGAYNENVSWWKNAAYIGKSLGLQPGALWTGSWVDNPHYQLASMFDENYQSISNSVVKSKYGNPTTFAKSFTASGSVIVDEWGNLSKADLTKILDKYFTTTNRSCYLYKKAHAGTYISKVAKGKEVYIIKDNGKGMSYCLLADGSKGYIYNGSLKKSLSSYKKCIINHSTKVYGSKTVNKKISVDKTNLTKVAKSNTKYTLYSVGSKWARIKYDGKAQWISKSRITII